MRLILVEFLVNQVDFYNKVFGKNISLHPYF